MKWLIEIDGQESEILADEAFISEHYPDAVRVENEQEAVRPEIVITSLTPSAEHADDSLIEGLHNVTMPAGSVLTVTCELRLGDQVLPVTEAFRMPLVARDGRERVVLVRFEEGAAVFIVPLTESRVWQVTEDAVNSALPADRQMRFAGLTVYVVEAA